MKRLAAVLVIALAGFAGAIVIFNDPAKKGCPLAADEDSSYSGRFVGPVSMDETRHVVQVTKNGTPVSGAKVCVNTEMVGMSGMGYSAKGRELGPGRYQVGFQFGMAGKYRGNLVTNEGGHEVSIPLLIKVASSAPRSRGTKSSNGK
jgi:YtkA-like